MVLYPAERHRDDLFVSSYCACHVDFHSASPNIYLSSVNSYFACNGEFHGPFQLSYPAGKSVQHCRPFHAVVVSFIPSLRASCHHSTFHHSLSPCVFLVGTSIRPSSCTCVYIHTTRLVLSVSFGSAPWSTMLQNSFLIPKNCPAFEHRVAPQIRNPQHMYKNKTATSAQYKHKNMFLRVNGDTDDHPHVSRHEIVTMRCISVEFFAVTVSSHSSVVSCLV